MCISKITTLIGGIFTILKMWNIFYSPHVQIMRRPSPCIIICLHDSCRCGSRGRCLCFPCPSWAGAGAAPWSWSGPSTAEAWTGFRNFKWKKNLLFLTKFRIMKQSSCRKKSHLCAVCCILICL